MTKLDKASISGKALKLLKINVQNENFDEALKERSYTSGSGLQVPRKIKMVRKSYPSIVLTVIIQNWFKIGKISPSGEFTQGKLEKNYKGKELRY